MEVSREPLGLGLEEGSRTAASGAGIDSSGVGDQIIQQRFVYPGEAIVVAITLTIVPYLLMRGLVTRIKRKK